MISWIFHNNLILTFASILNMGFDWFTKFKIGWSFPCSFFGWFSSSSSYLDHLWDFSYALEPPYSPNITTLLRPLMRSLTLKFISMTCCSMWRNLFSTWSWGLFTYLFAMIRVLQLLAQSIYLPCKYTQYIQINLFWYQYNPFGRKTQIEGEATLLSLWVENF